jgi:hypothetical protein
VLRGRPPKPAQLKLISGNPGKRRINTGEPQSTPLAGPPKALPAQYLPVWREIVEAAPPGVLRQADVLLVELTVRLLAQVRASAEIQPGIVTQLRLCLAAMGLDPTSRCRLTVSDPVAANPFADI